MFSKIQGWAIFIVLIYSLCSCSSKPSNELLLNEINSGLVQSNTAIHLATQNTIELFKQKLDDPVTQDKAGVYYPKIQRFQQLTTSLTKYIDSLKQLLQTETGIGKSYSAISKSSNKSVSELFVANNQYKELYQRLKQFRTQTFDTDSMLLGRLKDHIILISKGQDSINNDNFLKQFFTDASPLEALTYLNRLQNNTVIAEMKCMHFYNDQVMTHRPWFNSFEAILGQNAKVLKAGDYLEIIGGVGSFSKQRLLQFSVDGQPVEPNERGMAVYKFKTSKKLGSYSVPVHVRVLDEDSVEQTRTFTVEYTLVDAIRKH